MNRDSKIDWNAPVRAIEIVQPHSGLSVRDALASVWTDTSISPVGGQAVPAEGKNERIGLWWERFVRRSTDFVSQPEILLFEIDGYFVKHIPDYRVRRSGFSRVEFKGITQFAYKPYLSAKLKAIKCAYDQLGHQYEAVTSKDLWRQPLASAVDEIWRARNVRVDPILRNRVIDAFDQGACRYGDLAALLGHTDPRQLLALHADGTITIDIKSSGLSAESTVFRGALDLGCYAGELP